VTVEAPGTNCAAGGIRVDVAAGPSYVCNAASSLIVSSDEPPGLHCEVGGVRFDLGRDSNGNGTLDGTEITQTRYVCSGIGAGTGFVLTRPPAHATVFDSIERTYRRNSCGNSLWNRDANIIVTAQACDAATRVGYWAHAPDAAYPADPDHDLTQPYMRLVQVPATDTVVFTVGLPDATSRGAGDASVANIRVGTISRTTGLISNVQTAVFSDGYQGKCQLLSSSRTALLCYDGNTTIRFYGTAFGSPTLTLRSSVTLVQQLSQFARCQANIGQWCLGGTFAFDGANFYFAALQGDNGNLHTYVVYTAAGALLGTFVAAGGGNINNVYFDWSSGRYSSRDAYGVRTGGTVFGSAAASQSFGPVSPNHTLY
jgi:hypothetical protein